MYKPFLAALVLIIIIRIYKHRDSYHSRLMLVNHRLLI